MDLALFRHFFGRKHTELREERRRYDKGNPSLASRSDRADLLRRILHSGNPVCDYLIVYSNDAHDPST